MGSRLGFHDHGGMASFIYVLIDTVVARLLDPVVLVAAVVVILALCSGLLARVVETLEARRPGQSSGRTANESPMSQTAAG